MHKHTTNNVPKDLKETHVDSGAGDYAARADCCEKCGGVRVECWHSYRYTTVSLCRCCTSNFEIIGYDDISNPIFARNENVISAEDVIKFEKALEDRFKQVAREQGFYVAFKYSTISKLDDGTFQAKLKYDTRCPAGEHKCTGCQGVTYSITDEDPWRYAHKTLVACSGNAEYAIEKVFKEFKEQR